MLKRPSVFYSSYSNIHCFYCNNSNPTATSTIYIPPLSNRKSKQTNPQRQCYATVNSERPNYDDANDPPWPELLNSRTTPTPYQIFSIKKGTPYSKRRFYELAKIYHPDRNGHGNGRSSINHLPRSILMERYRLIVTAHEILSDPVKRRAYDAFGAGWNGTSEHGIPKQHWKSPKGSRWTGFDTNDSPFNNATWEDWEKWYQRGKRKPEPVYFSNGGFLTLVIAVILVGAFGQSLRLGNYADTYKRQVELAHDNASKALRKHKTESSKLGNQDQRLQNFLMARDPHGYGITDIKEQSYRKLLPEPEVCMSEGIQQQGHGHDQNSA